MSDIKTEESTNATEASTGEAPTKTTEHDVQYQDEETKAQVRFILKFKLAYTWSCNSNLKLFRLTFPKLL